MASDKQRKKNRVRKREKVREREIGEEREGVLMSRSHRATPINAGGQVVERGQVREGVNQPNALLHHPFMLFAFDI